MFCRLLLIVLMKYDDNWLVILLVLVRVGVVIVMYRCDSV